ncbi:hypothetical protein BR93DRAFT_923048 [Coniochaeta sp. PMI_546]|nr:hypothetical protein BR93DRAFT_923048 [Coniochaeta sp. PMI_546]
MSSHGTRHHKDEKDPRRGRRKKTGRASANLVEPFYDEANRGDPLYQAEAPANLDYPDTDSNPFDALPIPVTPYVCWGKEKPRPPRETGPAPRPAPSSPAVASSSFSGQQSQQQDDDDLSCFWCKSVPCNCTTERADAKDPYSGMQPPHDFSDWSQTSSSVNDNDYSSGYHVSDGNQDDEDEPGWMQPEDTQYQESTDTGDAYIDHFQHFEQGGFGSHAVISGHAWTDPTLQGDAWIPEAAHEGNATDYEVGSLVTHMESNFHFS